MKGAPLRVVKSVWRVSGAMVGLLFVLSACSRPDDARERALETRVATLEAQVQAMQKAQATRSTRAGSTDDSPQQATARAAAQYCATQLASSLEEFRQDNARYPGMSALTLPSACQGFRVAWTALDKAHYHFQVSGQTGSVLASEVR